MSAAPSSSAAAAAADGESASRALALNARAASRTLKSLGYPVRRAVLRALAAALVEPANVDTILAANAEDLSAARAAAASSSDASATVGSGKLSASSLARLELTASKLATLSAGLAQLADPRFVADPVDRLLKETLVAEGLVLQQRTVPLGVLLVIFESRPDVLPQLVGLAALSSNGLLLKGGSESSRTLAALHALATRAITTATDGRVNGEHLVALVSGRSAVGALLALDDCIDLVIPRGGAALVAFVKANTRIPVLGHADGVCHVYLDDEPGDLAAKCALIVDAKTDYPAACNAMETLLLHEALLTQPGLPASDAAAAAVAALEQAPAPLPSAVHYALATLRAAGVTMLLGPAAVAHRDRFGSASPFAGLAPADSLHMEYGDLTCCVELVSSLEAAVAHIHAHGSGHTEVILSSNRAHVQTFIDTVDSACVFANASSRFADGFRMGLGAEVGISTSRIHARGPVGVDGLCTTKWTMRSDRPQGHPVKPFNSGKEKFIHKQMDIAASL